jgi:hypothetical protein
MVRVCLTPRYLSVCLLQIPLSPLGMSLQLWPLDAVPKRLRMKEDIRNCVRVSLPGNADPQHRTPVSTTMPLRLLVFWTAQFCPSIYFSVCTLLVTSRLCSASMSKRYCT